MFAPLLADAWQDFFKALPFIVALLVWVINQFAGKVKVPPPKRVPPATPVAPQPPRPVQQAAQQPGQKPLQAEIDEFLRQAQSLREGRPVPPRQPAAGQQAAPQQPAVASKRPGRPQETTAKRKPPRQTMQPQRPLSSAPSDTSEEERPRESVAQYVAEHIDSSRFAQRATSLSQLQQESDSEFQQHMSRVFDRDLGKLKPTLGVFEAAGATAAAAATAATNASNVSAAGNESATAPTTIHKTASNIALFLAGRKNIRDAVILTEILQRPEHRW